MHVCVFRIRRVCECVFFVLVLVLLFFCILSIFPRSFCNRQVKSASAHTRTETETREREREEEMHRSRFPPCPSDEEKRENEYRSLSKSDIEGLIASFKI